MSYAVVYKECNTGRVEAVIGRGLAYHHADTLSAQMQGREREGMYFKAVNENELPDAPPPPPPPPAWELAAADLYGWIAGALAVDPEVKATPLLRSLRASGRSCSDGRFRDLVAKAKADLP